MSPLILIFPDMYAEVGLSSPLVIRLNVSSDAETVTSASALSFGDVDGTVLDVDLPLAGTVDVEQVRVVHAGGLGWVDPRRQGVEELFALMGRA